MAEAETTKRKQRRGGPLHVVLITLSVVIIGGILAMRVFVQPFRIPSASMAPTIVPGEYVALRHASAEDLAVGDLVAHRYDDGAGPRSYFRRVVALPGQRIAFENGVPVLDGVKAESVPDGATDEEGFAPHRETLAGRTYSTQHLEGEPYAEGIRDVAEIVVPEGRVYLVGDNRDNSMDSRIEGPYALADVTHRGGWLIVTQRDRFGQPVR